MKVFVVSCTIEDEDGRTTTFVDQVFDSREKAVDYVTREKFDARRFGAPAPYFEIEDFEVK